MNVLKFCNHVHSNIGNVKFYILLKLKLYFELFNQLKTQMKTLTFMFTPSFPTIFEYVCVCGCVLHIMQTFTLF